jgi:hypothetical protein
LGGILVGLNPLVAEGLVRRDLGVEGVSPLCGPGSIRLAGNVSKRERCDRNERIVRVMTKEALGARESATHALAGGV